MFLATATETIQYSFTHTFLTQTMKIALTPDGDQIEAAPDAPAQAICPHCGGTVLLRGRRLMGTSAKSYYWRHAPGTDPNCPARSRITPITSFTSPPPHQNDAP
jgi:hypothetical protein